jgi:hypothetical protein
VLATAAVATSNCLGGGQRAQRIYRFASKHCGRNSCLVGRLREAACSSSYFGAPHLRCRRRRTAGEARFELTAVRVRVRAASEKMSTLLQKVMGSNQTYSVTRSPTVGLGVVMKEAMMDLPESQDRFPVIIITELKQHADGTPGPAKAAGIEVGDIVVSVGDPPVNVSTFEQFGACVRDHNEVILTVLRAENKGDNKKSKKPEPPPRAAAAAPDAAGSEDVEEDEDPGYASEEDQAAEDDDGDSAGAQDGAGGDDYVEGSYEFEDEESDESDDDDHDDHDDDAASGDDAGSPAAATATSLSSSSAAALPAAGGGGAAAVALPPPTATEASPAKPPRRTRSSVDLKGDEPLEILWRGTKEIAAGQVRCAARRARLCVHAGGRAGGRASLVYCVCADTA